MQISGNDTLCDVPILDVRKVFREHLNSHRDYLSKNWLKDTLHLSDAHTKQILTALVERGLVTEGKVTKDSGPDDSHYPVTDAGQEFARASALKRISREKANALVADFMKRIEEVNQGKHGFPHRIKTVVVFGSFLTDIETLGDVDFAVELTDLHEDREKQKAAEDARGKGRTFSNMIDSMRCSKTEVKRFLENRKRIAVQEWPNFLAMNTPKGFSYKVLLGNEAEVEALLKNTKHKDGDRVKTMIFDGPKNKVYVLD
jgi:DNA-binding PadR family transcriptional regulator